jgi:hypothetical protein
MPRSTRTRPGPLDPIAILLAWDRDPRPDRRLRTPLGTDARAQRLERAFEWPRTIAALLVIPVLVVEDGDYGQPWETIATGTRDPSMRVVVFDYLGIRDAGQ